VFVGAASAATDLVTDHDQCLWERLQPRQTLPQSSKPRHDCVGQGHYKKKHDQGGCDNQQAFDAHRDFNGFVQRRLPQQGTNITPDTCNRPICRKRLHIKKELAPYIPGYSGHKDAAGLWNFHLEQARHAHVLALPDLKLERRGHNFCITQVTA